MSYQVLARKWRPARFREMIGQEHVLKALVNALDDDRLHHAYLFTGTRGVGKTSIARLFAKSLNCETGVSSTPCGECSACKEIAEGRFVDLIEVDAASRTKVEDTRELMENVQYAPTYGRYKVYLIDEVHMLSTHSFNALLKTLEEPPPHVKFLLATTDPQKLPITILSRCLQFNLKNLIPECIVKHLSHVLGEENITFEEPALWLLARSADGSMRDAMSLTDQAIAFGAGVINEADVRAMLGTIDQRLVYKMLFCLVASDARALMATVADLAQYSPDYNTVLGDLISVLHRIALAQTIPDAVDNSMGDMAQVQELTGLLTAEDIQLYYQIALMGRKDLPFVPDPREGLEMVLLRMLAFRPAGAKPRAVELQNSSVLGHDKVEPSQDTSPGIQTNEPVVNMAEAVSIDRPDPLPEAESPIEAVTDQPVAPQALNPESDLRQDELPAYDEAEYAAPQSGVDPRKKFEGEGPEQESTPPWNMDESEQSFVNDQTMQPLGNEHAPSESKADVKSIEIAKSSVAVKECSRDLGAIQLSDWVHIGRNLGLSGMTESLATHISLEEIRSDAVVLHYTKDQKTMLNEVQQQRISDALNTYFSASVSVEFVQAIQTQETPAQYLNRKREERHSEAITSIRNDETVKQLQQHFDAQIVLSSVQPID